MKRILIVNVNWLGDVLFTTPAIRAIRKSNPDSYIACMLPARCRELLETNPDINELILFDEKTTHRSILKKLAVIKELREKRFDIAFLFHRSLTRLLIVYLARIKRRIGVERSKTSFLLTDRVICRDRDSVHRIDYFLNIVKKDVGDVENKELGLYVTKEDQGYIEGLLSKEGVKENEKFVVINPGANWMLKRWPAKNFARLADSIINTYNIKIILSGSKNDLGLADEIVALMKNSIICFAGKTSLRQLAALMRKSSLVITSDTGPLHIALAIGAKTISIFGPTSAAITGPIDITKHTVLYKDMDCPIPCYNLDCSDNRCMSAVTADDVMASIRNFKIF